MRTKVSGWTRGCNTWLKRERNGKKKVQRFAEKFPRKWWEIEQVEEDFLSEPSQFDSFFIVFAANFSAVRSRTGERGSLRSGMFRYIPPSKVWALMHHEAKPLSREAQKVSGQS